MIKAICNLHVIYRKKDIFLFLMCNTTSGVNGSLAWELIIGIYEPARKSKISRQKVLIERQTTGISTFSGRQNVVWLLKKVLQKSAA